MKRTSKYGETALHRVVSAQNSSLHLRIVNLLHSYGANVNCRNHYDQNTALLLRL